MKTNRIFLLGTFFLCFGVNAKAQEMAVNAIPRESQEVTGFWHRGISLVIKNELHFVGFQVIQYQKGIVLTDLNKGDTLMQMLCIETKRKTTLSQLVGRTQHPGDTARIQQRVIGTNAFEFLEPTGQKLHIYYVAHDSCGVMFFVRPEYDMTHLRTVLASLRVTGKPDRRLYCQINYGPLVPNIYRCTISNGYDLFELPVEWDLHNTGNGYTAVLPASDYQAILIIHPASLFGLSETLPSAGPAGWQLKTDTLMVDSDTIEFQLYAFQATNGDSVLLAYYSWQHDHRNCIVQFQSPQQLFARFSTQVEQIIRTKRSAARRAD